MVFSSVEETSRQMKIRKKNKQKYNIESRKGSFGLVRLICRSLRDYSKTENNITRNQMKRKNLTKPTIKTSPKFMFIRLSTLVAENVVYLKENNT